MIKKVKIKVTYESPDGINIEMDNEIIARLKLAGAKWYAQGMEIRTGVRDICFDLEIK